MPKIVEVFASNKLIELVLCRHFFGFGLNVHVIKFLLNIKPFINLYTNIWIDIELFWVIQRKSCRTTVMNLKLYILQKIYFQFHLLEGPL